MIVLKNNEALEFDAAGYPVEFVCRCDVGAGKPHLHLPAEQGAKSREQGAGSREQL